MWKSERRLKHKRKSCQRNCRFRSIKLKYRKVKMDENEKKEKQELLREQRKKIRKEAKSIHTNASIFHFYNLKQLLSSFFFVCLFAWMSGRTNTNTYNIIEC